jgi:uncharacterized protein (DUF2336 family)
MIVRQFVQWVRKAPPSERAEATSALARAYLYSDLSADDLAAAEGAMTILLDDPSPLVRRALSNTLASAESAPRVVMQALAVDQLDVALPVLSRSPVLLDDDLIDLVATGPVAKQVAIAGRPSVDSPLAAAIAEVGAAEACLVLLKNAGARIALFSLERIVLRFGEWPPMRECLLSRNDLPMTIRQELLSKLSRKLAGFVASRYWIDSANAECAAREACEKATVALAAETPREEIGELVQHLRRSGQLTAGLLLRALLSGNGILFNEALASLSGVPLRNVISYVDDANNSAFHALYHKAGLPRSAFSAFRATLDVLRNIGSFGLNKARGDLSRRMVEHVLSICSKERADNSHEVLALLRRFAIEAARDEAKLFCDDLVAENPRSHVGQMMSEIRLVA